MMKTQSGQVFTVTNFCKEREIEHGSQRMQANDRSNYYWEKSHLHIIEMICIISIHKSLKLRTNDQHVFLLCQSSAILLVESNLHIFFVAR